MREFFRGWRRKVGCVTLVMACVLMMGWMRSTITTDEIGIPTWNHGVAGLMSSGNSLLWITQDIIGETKELYPHVWMTVDSDVNVMDIEEINWSWRTCGFGFGEWSWLERRHPSSEGFMAVQKYRAIPYWSVTVPLTLLSAYLILWKPPTRKAESNA